MDCVYGDLWKHFVKIVVLSRTFVLATFVATSYHINLGRVIDGLESWMDLLKSSRMRVRFDPATRIVEGRGARNWHDERDEASMKLR